jgi:putative aldouronate transport system permease protein
MLFSAGLVPWYMMISNTLRLKDTIPALIAPYLIMPWFTLLMKSFLADIPSSIIEAGKIDGASEPRVFFSLVVPVSKPGLATVGLFILLMYWNDYYLSLMFIQNSPFISLQYMLYRIMANIDFLKSALAIQSGLTRGVIIPDQSVRMAMCVLAAGPMLFVFPFFQKYFAKGITVGSVKG